MKCPVTGDPYSNWAPDFIGFLPTKKDGISGLFLPRFWAMPKFLSFSEAKVAHPGTICLISDDSDFRSGRGRKPAGQSCRKSGEGFLPGKKRWFCDGKGKTKGLKGKEYTGWLVEQFHFKICNVFSQQVAEGVHLPRLYVPSPCWGYNLSWRVFPGQPESFCLGVWSRSAVSGRRGTVLDLPVNPYDALWKV